MLGGAGCGKTYTLDAIVHTLLIKGYQSHVCATTGKAASNVQGSTIFNSNGLRVPVINSRTKTYHKLKGVHLKEYQDWLSNIDLIIIDEFTMLSQTLLAYLDYRCREGNPGFSMLPFGGKAILLVGDPAQLPPVMGTSLWTKTFKSKEHRDGWTLYQLYRNVVKLNIVVRQNEEQDRFKEFLNNLRDGT